jgi:hypothetical protein
MTVQRSTHRTRTPFLDILDSPARYVIHIERVRIEIQVEEFKYISRYTFVQIFLRYHVENFRFHTPSNTTRGV